MISTPHTRLRDRNGSGDGNDKRVDWMRKEDKKSPLELSHILFEDPYRSGEMGVQGGRDLFPEVVAFHSAV